MKLIALSGRVGAAVLVALTISLALDNRFAEQLLRFFGIELLGRFVASATGIILGCFIWSERPGIMVAMLCVAYVVLDFSAVLRLPAIDYDPYQLYIPFFVLKILWVLHLLIGTILGGLIGGWFGATLRRIVIRKKGASTVLN